MARARTPNSLFEMATRLDHLEEAWAKVRGNSGCAGADGVTVAHFQQRQAPRLLALNRQLRDGSYKPQPLRLFEIPKPDGDVRRLAVPAVVDRIAQTAVTMVLTPIIEPDLEDVSFAYRPGRSVKQAVEAIQRYRDRGFSWIVEGDIERYFDRIPHDRLLTRLEEVLAPHVGGEAVMDLVALWLEAGALDLDSPGVGIPQGSPLSPLLSNLYLDTVDEHFVEELKGLKLVRFADDFVVLARDEIRAERALAAMREALAAQGLGLNPDKTRVVSFAQGFKFLGHLFVRSMVLKSVKDPSDGDMAPDSGEALLRWIAAQDRAQEAAERKLEAERAAGLEPGLRVLYVREPKRVVSLRNEAFTVIEGSGDSGRELIAIPPHRIDRIELGPATAIDDAALRQALATDTIVHFVTGHGETLGALAPVPGEHGGLHLAQARLVLDDDRRVDLARRIVDGRLRNQRALLHRLNRGRRLRELVEPLTQLNRLIRRIAVARDVPELLGFEGAAAAAYWPALARLVVPDWAVARQGRFKRQRHPAPDPLNVVLNYLAALISRDAHALAVRHGLHPGFAALHSAEDREQSCVYDLVEEFRAPLAEGLGVYLFNNRVLGEEMFAALATGAIRVGQHGQGAIIRNYEHWLERGVRSPRNGRRLQWRRLVEEQVIAYATHCRGGEPYRAYVMDY